MLNTGKEYYLMKRIMTKAAAVFMVILMIMALVGCGSKKRQPIVLTLSTEDSEAILKAAGITLPDASETSAAGTNIIYFAEVDIMNNYSESEVINTGFWTFREKYGCSVEYWETTMETRYDDLANLIMAANSPDFYPAGVSSEATFPMYCIKGTFVPVDNYIDYSEPLWEGMAEPADAFALGDRHFAFITDVTFRNICPYNRRVIEEWGFDDPADLYANDEWTWDVFYDMCVEFSDPDEDRYALDGYAYNGALTQEASGAKFVEKDDEGHYVSNLDDPILEQASQLIYDLVKNETVYHEGTNYWAGRDNHTWGAGVKDGRCLFYIAVFGAIQAPVEEMNAIWGDVTQNEVMFVPLPRNQNGDGEYYLASIPSGYMLVNGGRNPEGVALYAACERFKIVDPTVERIDRKQLQEKYLWTDEMLEMYDECRRLILKNTYMYLNGNFIDNLNTAYNHFRDDIARGGANTTWAQLKESYSENFDYYLEEQNAVIEEYIAANS